MQTLLISTLTVALAEIGDKTQLLALILAAKYRKPLPICAGILAATLVNHALAGAFGTLIAAWLGPQTLRWIVALSFLAHRGVDAQARSRRRKRSRARQRAQCVCRGIAEFFSRRDGRQDPDRHRRNRRAISSVVAGDCRHHDRHAAGRCARGLAGYALCRPAAAASRHASSRPCCLPDWGCGFCWPERSTTRRHLAIEHRAQRVNSCGAPPCIGAGHCSTLARSRAGKLAASRSADTNDNLFLPNIESSP